MLLLTISAFLFAPSVLTASVGAQGVGCVLDAPNG